MYAAGAILYQVLSGVAPYLDGAASLSAASVLERLRAGPPSSLATTASDAPEELAAICDRAMERDPGRRYAGMDALAADLRAFLEDRVVRAHRTGAWPEIKKWVRRNRTAAAALCLAARVPGCRVVGLELRRDLAGLAAENVAINGMTERVEVLAGDLLRSPPALGHGGFDHVMANPPFLERGRASPSPDPAKAAAEIDGYDQDQRFFLNWATVWRRNFLPDELRLRLNTDPHAPAGFRAIGAPSNMPAFAEAFNCKAGDAMVRGEKERVRIW